MRCDRCPCPADVTCLGPTTHPHFCQWAEGSDPGQHRLIVARSGQPEPPLPSLWTQAANAAAAAVEIVVDVVLGKPILAPADVQEARRATCLACEHWRPSDSRCSRCGCYTEAKLSLASEACPDGHWPAVPPSDP